jgi:tripartite-type tricarboxylate transporter receptor subunit TctC
MKLARYLLLLSPPALLLAASIEVGWAQPYPTRPVRLLGLAAEDRPTCSLPHGAGVSDRLGKQFYVENVPGAGGNIGTGRAAQAAPDGYRFW